MIETWVLIKSFVKNNFSNSSPVDSGYNPVVNFKGEPCSNATSAGSAVTVKPGRFLLTDSANVLFSFGMANALALCVRMNMFGMHLRMRRGGCVPAEDRQG